MACDLLLDVNSKKYKELLRIFKISVASNNGSRGLECFISSFPALQARINIKDGDDSLSIMLNRNRIYNDLISIIDDSYVLTNGEKAILRSKVEKTINLSDNTVEDIEVESPILDNEEASDNDDILDYSQHIKNVYGSENSVLAANLQQNYQDEIFNLLFYNKATQSLVNPRSRKALLDISIRSYKQEQFGRIARYLLHTFSECGDISEELYNEDGTINQENYDRVISAFKRYVLNDHSNDEKLGNLYSRLSSELSQFNENIERKNAMFDRLVTLARQNGVNIDSRSKLYEATHFTKEYLKLRKSILSGEISGEWVNDAREIIHAIDGSELIDAVRSFSKLVYFDSLLKENFGDFFDIGSNGNYSYKRNVANMRRGWTDVDENSDYRVAPFTKLLLSQVDMYRYEDGLFLNKKENVPVILETFLNLLNGLTSQNTIIELTQSGELSNELRTLALNIYENPVENFYRILNILFEDQLNEQTGRFGTKEVNHTRYKSGILSDSEINILYSVYRAIKPLYESRNYQPAARAYLNEIVGLAVRNVSQKNLSIEVNLGSTSVDVLSNSVRNRTIQQAVNGINTFATDMSLDGRLNIRDKYRPEVTEIEISPDEHASQMTFNLDNGNDNYSISVVFGSTEDLFNRRGKVRYEFKDDGTLQKISEDSDIINKYYTFKRGGELSEEDRLLCSRLDRIFEFIQDTTGYGDTLTKDQAVLNQYKYAFKSKRFDNFLDPFILVGARSLYANNWYIASLSTGQDVMSVIQSENLELYNNSLNKGTSIRAFTIDSNNLLIADIISQSNDGISQFCRTKTDFVGLLVKSTVRSKEGTSLANRSLLRMISIFKYWMNYQNGFLPDLNDIIKITHDIMYDQELTINFDTYNMGKVSEVNMLDHEIFDLFFSDGGKTIMFKPIICSDKALFPVIKIVPETIGEDAVNLLHSDNTVVHCISLAIARFGKFYENLTLDTIVKLTALLDGRDINDVKNELLFEEDIIQRLGNIHEVLLNNKLTREDLASMVAEYNARYTNDDDKIFIEEIKDYVVVKDADGNSYVDVNPLLGNLARIFSDYNSTQQYLREQAADFVNCLQYLGYSPRIINIKYSSVDEYTGKVNTGNKKRYPTRYYNLIANFFSDKPKAELNAYIDKWVDHKSGQLIIAKQNGNDIIYRNDEFDKTKPFELNPLYEKYFYVNSLYGNYFRYAIVGSEVNQKWNNNTPLDIAQKISNIHEWNLWSPIKLNSKQFELLQSELTKYSNIPLLYFNLEQTSSPVVNMALEWLRTTTMNFCDATAQNTQDKRNQSVTTTVMTPMIDNVHGVLPNMLVACVQDEGTIVWDGYGNQSVVGEVNDGSADITVLQALLENISYGPSGQFGINRKPSIYYNEGGTAVVVKFAAFTMTNEKISNSRGNDRRLDLRYRKMTDIKWNEDDDMIPEDLNFRDLLNGGRLYYKSKGGDIVEITDLGFVQTENGKLYYTEEYAGNTDVPEQVYHLFSKDGKHYRIRDASRAAEMLGDTYESINSIYDLTMALGGFDCVDMHGLSSDFNYSVIVNLMENDAERKQQEYLDALNYEKAEKGDNWSEGASRVKRRPLLKEKFISYLCNLSAIKNGAKNLNPPSAWSDDSQLQYFKIGTYGLGAAQNPESPVDGTDVSMFVQVIAALTLYGYTTDVSTEVFSALARVGSPELNNQVEILLNSVDSTEEQKNTARSKIYDVIGRVMFMNRGYGQARIQTELIEGIKSIFSRFTDHSKDESKFPYSDPNIYKDFISQVASLISSDAIRIRLAGMSNVQCPSYNIVQYYDFDGVKYFPNDILELAREDYKRELIKGLQDNGQAYGGQSIRELELAYHSLYGDNMPEYYSEVEDPTHMIKVWKRRQLGKLQARDASWFVPGDAIDIFDANGKYVSSLNLNTLSSYRVFKQNAANGFYEGYTLRNSVVIPSNLKATIHRWKTSDGKYMNIFDLPFINENTPKNKEYYKFVQEAIVRLYVDGVFTDANGNIVHIDRNSLEYIPGDIVSSYQNFDIFDIPHGTPLSTIMREGENFFKAAKFPTAPVNNMYDIVFMRSNGNYTMVTIGLPGLDVDEDNDFLNNCVLDSDGTLWYMQKKGGTRAPLFAAAKYVEENGVYYDSERDVFIRDGAVLNRDEYRVNGTKCERLHKLVRKSRVAVSVKNSDVPKTRVIYYVSDISEFNSVYGKQNGRQEMLKTLAGLYGMKQYSRAQLNINAKENIMVNTKAGVLQDLLDYISENDPSQRDINKIQKGLLSKYYNNKDSEFIEAFNNALNRFHDDLASKRWLAFNASLEFVSAHIPTQSLQSFSALRLVGFINTGLNTVYCSPFQAFIQNSDFDIDTAELIGQHINENGTYEAWSPYFNYRSKQLFAMSRRLPMPRGERVRFSRDGADITNEARIILDSNNRNDAAFLGALTSALNKIHSTDNAFTCADDIDADALASILNKHEMFQSSERAIRNLISSGIYVVSSDLRNYVVSNIPVSVAPLKTSGEKSALSTLLNMANSMNPISNILRASDKIKGKQCVSSASNGLKFWCYYYYQCIEALRRGENQNMHLTYTGIDGRSRGLTDVVTEINSLPDIPQQLLPNGVISDFANVPVMLSTLIQGAADNTKENTLTRINATPDLIKLHIYLTTIGFDISDINAFMICPAVDTVVQLSDGLLYEHNGPSIWAGMATARGAVSSSSELRGNYLYTDEDGNFYQMSISKLAFQLLGRRISDLSIEEQNEITKIENKYQISPTSINNLVEATIKYLVLNNDEKAINEFFDNETLQNQYCRNYFNRCKQVALTILKSARAYKNGNEQYFKDLKLFTDIYLAAEEMTNITVGFYSLNKGVRGDLDSILQSLNKIGNVVRSRELAIGINKNNMFGLRLKTPPDINNDYISKNKTWLNVLQNIRNNMHLPVIQDPIEMVNDQQTQHIIAELKLAASENIMGNFSPMELVTNSEYREKAQRYYETIKDFTNAIALVYNNPFFGRIMNEFNNLLNVINISSAKNRIVMKYLNSAKNNMRGLSRFADEVVMLDVLKNFETVKIRQEEGHVTLFNGFDAAFNRAVVDSFNLSDIHGIAGFVNFVTTDFYQHLKARFSDNLAVQHLVKLRSNGKIMLSMNIDLNEVRLNQQEFFEIVYGMKQLSNYNYSGNYTYADILQLYSIIVNNNLTDDTRLTNAFMDFTKESVMSRYFTALGELDWSNRVIDVSDDDVSLNLAIKSSQRNGIRKGLDYIWCKNKQTNTFELFVLNRNTSPYRYVPKLFLNDAAANRDFMTYSPILSSSVIDSNLNPVDHAFSVLDTDDTALRDVLMDLKNANRIIFQNDNGIIRIGVFSYADETEDGESENLYVNDEDGSNLIILFQDIGRSQSKNDIPSMRTIISCIKNMDAMLRADLCNSLKNEYSSLSIKNAIANGELVGNVTIKQLADWAAQSSLSVQDNYNIIYSPDGCTINGRQYRGRIVYKGKVYYVITSPSDAVRFLKYVRTIESTTTTNVIKYCNEYNSLNDEDKSRYYNIYGFYGYSTKHILTPITGKVFDSKGRYRGWYIYTDGRKFYIAPTVISEDSYYRSFSKLNDAILEIDNIYDIEPIEKNCLISIKQPSPHNIGYRIESDMAHDGMLISALDTSVANVKIKDLPSSYRNMFNNTLREFKKKCGKLVDGIETSEQAAVFIYKVYEDIPSAVNNDDFIGTVKNEANRERIKNIVNEIVNMQTCYLRLKSAGGGTFYFEQVAYNQYNLTKQLPVDPFISSEVVEEIPEELKIPIPEEVKNAEETESVEETKRAKEPRKARESKKVKEAEKNVVPKTMPTRTSNDVVNDGTVCKGLIAFFNENLGANIEGLYNSKFKEKYKSGISTVISEDGVLGVNLTNINMTGIKPYLVFSLMNDTFISKLSDESFSQNRDKILEWKNRLNEKYKKTNYIQMLDILNAGREILGDEAHRFIFKLTDIVDINISRMRRKLSIDGNENDLLTPFTESETATINAKLLIENDLAKEENC